MVRSTDRPAMTIAVDLGRKSNKQTNNQAARNDYMGYWLIRNDLY